MNAELLHIVAVNLVGRRAMHPAAGCSSRHTASFLLARNSAPHRHALTGKPIKARSGAFSCSF